MRSTSTTITRTAAKAAFTHVMDNVIQNTNVTKALIDNGIKDIVALLILTDEDVDSLTYNDSDPNVITPHCINMGEIGLVKAFIHFVHYCKEINIPIDDQWLTITQDEFDQFRANLKNIPIDDQWLTITQDEFDQFRANLKYTRRFAYLSSLQPLAMSISSPSPSNYAPVDMQKIGNEQEPSMTVKDELLIDQQYGSFANTHGALDARNVHDIPDIHDLPDVHDVTNVLDVTNVHDVTNVVDVSYDLSTISDISHFTTTGEVLMVHHLCQY
jgi:hypothetical protein